MVAPSPSPFSQLEAECRALLAPVVPEGASLRFERPREPGFGALSCNVAFGLSREQRRSPMAIAEEMAARLDLAGARLVAEARALKGYVNFYLRHDAFARTVLDAVREQGVLFGRPAGITPRHVLIEHTSVNPNKPWHIGHVRNAVLGDVLGRLFRLAGHDVEIQNYIDDTGKQVADMMFGLQYLGLLGPDGMVTVPPDRKADHFFGDAYVAINRLVAEKAIDPTVMEAGSAAFMHAREAGEFRELVRNIVFAQLSTAWRMGIFYDLLSWEGDILQADLFDEAMIKLRASSVVYQQTEGRHAGCLVIDMGEFLPDGAGEMGGEQQIDHPTERVLIRSNGMPTYTAKDIAYHMWKFGLLTRDMRYKLDTVQPNGEELWTSAADGGPRSRHPAGEVINLIDKRQELAQKVVKASLQVTGHAREAAAHFHLGYGVVSPKGGAFSGRKGTEYSADGVLDSVVTAQRARAAEKATERGVAVPEEELSATSELVAVAALRYLMCRYDPRRDIEFTVEEVIDGNGNTGLYIQYAYARVQSIFRKGGYEAQPHEPASQPWDDADPALLVHEQERALIALIARLPDVVEQLVENLNVHTLAAYAHDLAETFSLFYEHCPILRSDVPPELKLARLALAAATARTMRNAAGLLGLALPDRL